MQQMYIVFFQMAVGLILGFALRKRGVLDERSEKALSEMLSKAILPFSIIGSSQYTFSDDVFKGMAGIGVVSVIYYGLSFFTVWKILKKTNIDNDEKRVMTMTMVFANTGFIGFPMMKTLFGATGLLFAAIYNLSYNLFFFTYGIHIYSKQNKFYLKGILFNVVSMASIASVILFVIPWRMPVFMTETIDVIGNMTAPLSMIVLGSIFSTVDIKKVFTDYKSFLVAGIRLLVFPAIVLGGLIAAKHYIPILPATAGVMLLMTALPSGTLNVIYAEKYNTAPKFATRTVVLSTVLMTVTMPVFVFLANYFFR